jgi:uncharacterized protein
VSAPSNTSREFQVFVKPIGSLCNLGCSYCYYLSKEQLFPKNESFRMPEDILEEYIVQHIKASGGPVISFSWHGGEPTVLGLDYFRKIVALQREHQPGDSRIVNGIQTNGTLLNKEWCDFFAHEGFVVGLSLDGPEKMHNQYRRTKNGQPSFHQTIDGYKLLNHYNIPCEILCVVHGDNVPYPIPIYRFFKQLGVKYITFLPLVEPQIDSPTQVSERSVPAKAWGNFLCEIFDEWKNQDIGQIKVQIFEEAVRPAFGQKHTLCIFRETCGDVPVIEHNGDFYSCDHYVDPEHRVGNICETPFIDLLESPVQRAFGQNKLDNLPQYCQACEVKAMCNGECPKNRILFTPDGEPGLNYLCDGYKQFFNHCLPFIKQVSALWQQQSTKTQTPQKTVPASFNISKIPRNAPCPCGSGKKFKQCCKNKYTG